MDLMKTEYEFLDLSDVREADRSSLQCALFKNPATQQNTAKIAAIQSVVDLSVSTSRRAATVSSSVESVPGEGDMSPHSPARTGAAGGAGPPPPYAQPPPAYPPPHHQWPVAPPNVYVSQVTANVNVHGYMGQYYQPGPQYPPAPAPPADRASRPHRRDRRPKRPPSPPHAPHPYYLQYPHYYPATQAQGAPLYHLPVYQPLVYGPYPYPPYYQEYPIPVEGEPDKAPEEYPPEVVMEQEAMDAYYASAHYPPYGPPVEAGVEYMPPVYLPPPPHMQPAPPPHQHQHHAPHQFNVHAKNFVQGQSKTFVPHDKIQESRSPPAPPSVSATGVNVDALPMKDLKIATRGPGSPKQNERPIDGQPKTVSPGEKPAPPMKVDTPKTSWTPPENKIDASLHNANVPKPYVPQPTALPPAANKLPPNVSKPTKGPAAPFSGAKQPPKPGVPQTIVPVQQAASTPKAPFGNRQKRDGPAARSPSSETTEVERAALVAEHMKREAPLPPSKAPMPISITLPPAGHPVIVASKPPFGHRKTVVAEPPPAPQPPPPAPTASDFPPPPTPRNRGEPPPPTPTPQPQPASGKSWASLFSRAPTAASEEVGACPPAAPPLGAPPLVKPVAKVPPFDASPSAAALPDKGSPPARGVPPIVPPPSSPVAISYSEKTSVNAVSVTTPPAPRTTPAPAPTEAVPTKEPMPLPQPSPFTDDPNSYRMGEFLSKYQLDNRPVSLLPRGLTNRSNYCYVNAILQALIACPPFYNMLKALPYQTRRGKSSTPVIDSMVELCYEFSGGARGRVVVPAGPALDAALCVRVRSALHFPGAQEGRQEDAEEFLGCLLNSLNDEMLELIKLVEPEELKDTNGQPNGVIMQEQSQEEDDDDDEWKVMGPRNRGAVERRWAAARTPVGDIFRGRTRVRLNRNHHDVTDAVQPFFTLQLDIERANNVKDALELLAGKDTLEGVNDAWQQLSIEQLPVVLLLHLKCFQLDSEGHTAKIVKNIDFPIDLKIDPKIMSSKQKYTTKQRVYKLFAVVYHEGVEAVKGHYLTDTYHGQVGWIRYDDSTVTQVTEAQVLKPKAPRMPYLLMYRRHDTLPPHRPVKE